MEISITCSIQSEANIAYSFEKLYNYISRVECPTKTSANAPSCGFQSILQGTFLQTSLALYDGK